MAEFFTPGTRDALTESRHRARYHFVGTFCRAGMRVLDVPCGSGYGAAVLHDTGIQYCGWDASPDAIDYARRTYEAFGGFAVRRIGTYAMPTWGSFDLVACIEGIEHLEPKEQGQAVRSFALSLTPSGTLVITSPEALGKSGHNPKNPYHLHELTREDFLALLAKSFKHIEVVTMREVLSTGDEQTCLYAVCRKPR